MIPVSELEAAREEHVLSFFKVSLWTFVQMDRLKSRITSVPVHRRCEAKLQAFPHVAISPVVPFIYIYTIPQIYSIIHNSHVEGRSGNNCSTCIRIILTFTQPPL